MSAVAQRQRLQVPGLSHTGSCRQPYLESILWASRRTNDTRTRKQKTTLKEYQSSQVCACEEQESHCNCPRHHPPCVVPTAGHRPEPVQDALINGATRGVDPGKEALGWDSTVCPPRASQHLGKCTCRARSRSRRRRTKGRWDTPSQTSRKGVWAPRRSGSSSRAPAQRRSELAQSSCVEAAL